MGKRCPAVQLGSLQLTPLSAGFKLLTLGIQMALCMERRDEEEEDFINTRRACAARVTVVVLYVCMYVCMYICMYVCVFVCLSAHAVLAVCTIKSKMKDAIVLSVRFAAILKWRFSLNCLIRKLERFLLTSAGAAIFS